MNNLVSLLLSEKALVELIIFLFMAANMSKYIHNDWLYPLKHTTKLLSKFYHKVK